MSDPTLLEGAGANVVDAQPREQVVLDLVVGAAVPAVRDRVKRTSVWCCSCAITNGFARKRHETIRFPYSYCTASTMFVLAAERAGRSPAKTPIRRPESRAAIVGIVG